MMQDLFALVKTVKWLLAAPLALVIKPLPALPQVVVETQRPYARQMAEYLCLRMSLDRPLGSR